ncbi:MAG: hypothetical protein KKE39_04380 [Bacteroidetes bacterium]|nr:hypothetical protein [Bacteroidota bacterium]MBU1372659.1 hypothetical protein [Bacteroidota bacterium]MBU1484855.1 hypothetical protein [Bacteroidota bacterium]MBU1761000.1 hypothetical protein [Bacteroidota bacterium]MBU2046311.1 hypothetical protein [Bacteroidota bacterium]
MKKHIFWMVIGCTLPLLLIFIAPALGLGSGITLFIFILAMFACHLLMPMNHNGAHEHDDKQHVKTLKKENHE